MEPTSSPSKSFFEKYQVFLAIIICGALIGGGIIISRLLPSIGQPAEQGVATKDSVRSDLITVAKKLGIAKNAFAACLDNGTNTEKINTAAALADQSGVTGTPTFFIIKRTFGANDAVVSEKQFTVLGARDQATFEKAIQTGKAPADQPTLAAGQKITLSADDHWFGPRRAEVVIVEYSDIDCPFCKAVKPAIDALLADHPEYAFVYRHSPIVSLHPFAAYKAEASECVTQLGGQEKFWKFLDAIVK